MGGMPTMESAAMPSSPGDKSYQRLCDLQNTTRETVGLLIDRLRPVLLQHPEVSEAEERKIALSGMAERVREQEEILSLLNKVIRDLDL